MSPGQLQYAVTWKTVTDVGELSGSSGTLKLEIPATSTSDGTSTQSENSDSVDRTLDGSWTGTREWEDRFADNNQRYRAKATLSAELEGTDGGIRLEWNETREVVNLDAGDAVMSVYEATFLVSRDEDRLTGQAEAARFRSGSGDWHDLDDIPFQAVVLPSGELQFEITWLKDGAGRKTFGSTGMLTKQ